MQRAVTVLLALALVVAGAPAAQAYTHFGATDNVVLSRDWSRELFPDGATVAILARSDTFADSLAAGALAGSIGAPVLLNPPSTGLDSRIAVALSDLGTDVVHVIGGTAAVSEQTVSDLEDAGYLVDRHAGTNRIATAVDVMQDTNPDAAIVFLARAFGEGSSAFADSLGAGMLAGSRRSPLLLTTTEALSPETRDALAAVETVVIVGGTAAVSPAVEAELTAMGIEVDRIAGLDRFETAARVADESFDATADPIVALVDGRHVNSWTSGFAASASAGGAVVLSDGATLPAATRDFLDSQRAVATTDDLYCAPEVDHDACLAAEALLNG